MRSYKNVRLFDDTSEDLDASIQKILEVRRAEKAAEEAESEENGEGEKLSFAGTGIEQALSEAGIFNDQNPAEE